MANKKWMDYEPLTEDEGKQLWHKVQALEAMLCEISEALQAQFYENDAFCRVVFKAHEAYLKEISND